MRASHARTLLPAALASVPFGFVLVRVRVPVCNKEIEVSKPRVRNKQEAILKDGRQMDEAEVVLCIRNNAMGAIKKYTLSMSKQM